MPSDDVAVMRTFLDFARAIARRDPRVVDRLRASPEVACTPLSVGATRANPEEYFLEEIRHHFYAGDTLLHVAAATYAIDVARALIDLGVDVRAKNRRGAEALHYAADGGPNLSTWDPRAQAEMVRSLLKNGADPNVLDKSGVAPLHRAVRTRSTGAVRALLAGGADPNLANRAGSKPIDLARMATGKSGAGTAEAKREQAAIVGLLENARGSR